MPDYDNPYMDPYFESDEPRDPAERARTRKFCFDREVDRVLRLIENIREISPKIGLGDEVSAALVKIRDACSVSPTA